MTVFFRFRDSNRVVAVKAVKDVFANSVTTKRIYREIHILRHLNRWKHPNIVTLVDVIPSTSILHDCNTRTTMTTNNRQTARKEQDLYLFFECVDSDLSKIIKSNQYLTMDHVRYIMFQLLKGIEHIHTSNVIHRDIKPANILINPQNSQIKIAGTTDIHQTCVLKLSTTVLLARYNFNPTQRT